MRADSRSTRAAGAPRLGAATRSVARVIALAGAAYLFYTLAMGSTVSAREHLVFWISVLGAAAALGFCLVKAKTGAVPLTWHVLAGAAAFTFVATLVTYGDPPLLRFGHAVALAIGNSVTLAVATWLARWGSVLLRS